MKTFNEFILEIRKRNSERPLSAKQNLNLKKIKPGQLHRIKNSGENTEFFYLVTNFDNGICDVIPGSLDGLMAGPDDIVLPKSVLGGFVFLSLDMAATLPEEAVGEGFAILDTDTYNRIIDSQIKYETDEEGEQPSYPFALPYTGKNDSRIDYHEKLSICVSEAQENLCWEQEACIMPKEFFCVFKFAENAAFAAAATQNIYEKELAVAGVEQSLYVTLDPEEKQLVIHVLDKNGEPSCALDHWCIYDEDGKLGELIDGVLDIYYPQKEQISLGLQNNTGEFCTLEPLK